MNNGELKRNNLNRIRSLIGQALKKGENKNDIILPPLLENGKSHTIKKWTTHPGQLRIVQKIHQIFK
jgi:hypothetical protein